MDDLISRQAAIDALKSQLSDWNDDYNIPVRKSIENIERLPSAPPEIVRVRCKDCKYWDTDYGLYGYCGRHGYHFSTHREGYCNLADRRK